MQIADFGGDISIQPQSDDSRDLVEIATRLMPEWLHMFAKKNADYGSDGAKVLGIKGQYADINRKMLKLKRAVWDDEPMNFEGPREIALDLIGHLFLTVRMLDEKEAAEREAVFGDGSMEEVEAIAGGHLKDAAEASLKKQIADAFTAGRLSMMPTAAEHRPMPGPEDFEYSNELQSKMLAERMQYARRIEAEQEVKEFESLPMSEQLDRLGSMADRDGGYQDRIMEATGFVESDRQGPIPTSVELERAGERMRMNLPTGVYELDSDGRLYKIPGSDMDRIPVRIIEESDLKYIADLGKALEEEGHINA